MRVALTGLLLCSLLSCQTTAEFTQQLTQPTNNRLTSQNTAAQNNRYYPVETGRNWVFELQQYQNDKPNPVLKEMRWTVVSSQNEGEQQTAVIKREQSHSTAQPHATLAQITSAGVTLSRYTEPLLIQAAGLTENPWQHQPGITVLKSPLTMGQTWPGRQFQGGSETIQVVGTESVTVPAGTFQAIKINHQMRYDNGKADDLYYWYAPGVGTVKLHEEMTVHFGEWMKLKAVAVLKSYGLPQQKP